MENLARDPICLTLSAIIREEPAMTTFTQMAEPAGIPIISREPAGHLARLLGGLRLTVLRRLRIVAWRVLDLGTEFEVVERGGKTLTDQHNFVI